MNVKFEIKSRWDGRILFELECASLKVCLEAGVKSRANLSGANLSGANLSGANLSGADLSRANLSGADLSGADLSRANLSRADLYGADLSGADLSRADLSRAKNANRHLLTPLRILLDQPGKLRAYKLVTEKMESPWAASNGAPVVKYAVGKSFSVKAPNKDEDQQCGAGINLATLDWCLKNWQEGYRLILLEFSAKDIAAIPTATDGKFRVKRCRVVKELKLSDYDWPPPKPEEKKPEAVVSAKV